MLAPDEKHLEAWITNHGLDAAPLEWGEGEICLVSKVLVNQAKLPCGIVDLLAVSHCKTWIYPIEIKRGAIDASALAQVLRYKHDLIWTWRYTFDCVRGNATVGCRVGAIVIGSSIERNIIHAAEAAGVTPIVYRFDGKHYQFLFADHDVDDEGVNLLSKTFIGDAMRHVFTNRLHEIEDELRAVREFREENS